MAFLDRIAECNNARLDAYVPFAAGGHDVGHLRKDRLTVLREVGGDAFLFERSGVALHPALADFDARSAALAPVVDALMARDEVRAWRGERYPALTAWGAPPLLELERAAVPWFGIPAYGVHVNGFVRTGEGIEMWVARRARDKPNYPGMLDNMVAGGQPIGLGLLDNVVKECGEEAGIPEPLARTARIASAVTYTMENESGLKPDCMFCFDLELPADFVPHPADGEAEGFHRWPLLEVARLVRDTREFKANCNLVIVDFLIRHGWIDSEDPELLALVRGLRAW